MKWGIVGFCGLLRRGVVFSGRYDHSLDEKGRVSTPLRFREILRREGFDRLVVTNFRFSNERCLEIYPPTEWDRLVERIRQRGSFTPDLQLFQAFFIGGAHEVVLDRQGRILIPPKLREFAGLDREVTFQGMTDHFQLWNKAALERVLAEAERNFDDRDFWRNLNL